MGTRINFWGIAIAALGFFLTRFTVSLTLYENPMQFYLAGVAPLALGLGLAAFGVAFAVADVEEGMVRTTALWCLTGFGTMLLLVLLTLLGPSPDGAIDITTIRSQTYLSNFLIGGSVGGTLTGLYAAVTRRQRAQLSEQTNRLVTLNRILRDSVLNSVAAIRGYTDLDPGTNLDPMPTIDRQATDIQQTIEEIKYLTEHTGDGDSLGPRELEADLRKSVDAVTERHPNAEVAVRTAPESVSVLANERLTLVLTHLLENAIVHGEDAAPTIEVAPTRTSVAVTVTDTGPGLPASQQSLLESGTIDEFDNPRAGFGLNIVRMLVTTYGGRIETTVTEGGTSVTVTLSRVLPPDAALGPNRSDLSGLRAATPHLVVAALASLLAGVAYGLVSEALGGSVAGIGVFYGTADPVVGWLTHEFHSVVFGFMYLGVLSFALERYRNTLSTYVGVGLVWGGLILILAAGVVAPVWLRLLGVPAPLPNLSFRLLVAHLVWGGTLGAFATLGYRYLIPRLAGGDLRE